MRAFLKIFNRVNCHHIIANLNLMKNAGNVLITGGTSGLGLELVKLFLKNGYNVAATGRQLLNLSGYKEKVVFRKACYDLIDPFLA